jgi:hypothetical protein
MSHKHFCDVAGHWWQCEGTALRRGDTEPSVCVCLPCGLPVEGFDHSGCPDPVELVACPEHRKADEAIAAPHQADSGAERGPVILLRRRPKSRSATRKQAILEERAEEAREDWLSFVPPEQDCLEMTAFADAKEDIRADAATVHFERFPLVPIEKGDPLWHCDDCCHCGCRRMPAELSGGFCLHCSHVYQRDDPEFWLGEESPHSEAAHLKGCTSYQEYHKKSEEGWAKFLAMSEGTDAETFSKLLSACYSQAIDDNYEAYMSAPEGSPERAAIVERIAIANAREIEARQQEFDAVFEKRKNEWPEG